MRKKILATILLLVISFVLMNCVKSSEKIIIATKNILLTVDTNENDLVFVAIADQTKNEIIEFCIYVKGDAIKMVNPSLMN